MTRTTSTVAAELGCHTRTVQRICKDHDIGNKVGSVIILTAADVRKIRKHYRGKPGNPNFGKDCNNGN